MALLIRDIQAAVSGTPAEDVPNILPDMPEPTVVAIHKPVRN